MAFDCFIKVGDISGECTDDKHKDWIEVLSYSHGVSQPSSGAASSGGGRSAERSDDQHKDWIECVGFNHNVSQPSGGALSAQGVHSGGRADHADFSIVKTLDKTSPKLALFCCNGKHIEEIKVELCRATENKEKYMEYRMQHVIVSSYMPGGSSQGGEALPLEEVSFNYGKIEWNYIEMDHKTGKTKGNVETWWDMVANKGG